MAGLLSGLSALGLGDLENADIFAEPEKKTKENPKTATVKPMLIREQDLIYDKAWECPVCHTKFTSKVTKSGKARLVETEKDLRPVYAGVDVQKYEVVLCPACGYTALMRYFPYATALQCKQIKELICRKVRLHEYKGETYSYEEAHERYQLALANAVVKHARISEKAYICLKTGWLMRGYAESLEMDPDATKEKIAQIRELEEANLKSAYEGFKEAVQTENFPICGMDETTLNYLMAALGLRFKDYDYSSRLVASILVSHVANSRIKDRARELKEELLIELRKKNKDA